MSELEAVKSKLKECGQEHLLQYWNDLKEEEKTELLKNIKEIDFSYVNKCFEQCRAGMDFQSLYKDGDLEPVPRSVKDSVFECTPENFEEYEQKGILVGSFFNFNTFEYYKFYLRTL